jgi:hypothetical protein
MRIDLLVLMKDTILHLPYRKQHFKKCSTQNPTPALAN